MCPRRRRAKPAREILRFVDDQPVAEFHDAHHVGWPVVIGQDVLGDPQLATAEDTPDREPLLVWLHRAALLDVMPAADPLARLRIVEHGILGVDVMLALE